MKLPLKHSLLLIWPSGVEGPSVKPTDGTISIGTNFKARNGRN